MSILDSLQARKQQCIKSIAVLVDPDKVDDLARLKYLCDLASENCVDFFFVGGSLITTGNLSSVISTIRENVSIPVVLS